MMPTSPVRPPLDGPPPLDHPLLDVLSQLEELAPLLGSGGGIIPVCSPRFCSRRNCKDRGKHPLTKHGVKDATTDPDEIMSWDRQFPYANIGLTSLILVDIDDHPNNGRDGIESILELCHQHTGTDLFTAFAGLVTVLTGGGGLQFWALCNPDGFPVPNSKDKIAPGIEVRGYGTYCVIPPSEHTSGYRYQYMNDLRIPTTCLPGWFDAAAHQAGTVLVRAERTSKQSKPRQSDGGGRGLNGDPATSVLASRVGPDRHREPADPLDVSIHTNPRAYVAAAMANAAEAIASTKSARNDTLNACVFGLARFIPHGYIAEVDIRALALQVAAPHLEAEKDPLERGAVMRTIESAVQAGKLNPLLLVGPEGEALAAPFPPVSTDRSVCPETLSELSVSTPSRQGTSTSGTPIQLGEKGAGQSRSLRVAPLRRRTCEHEARFLLVRKDYSSGKLLAVPCRRKECQVGRLHWVEMRLAPVREDFTRRPIYRINLANENAWASYRSQVSYRKRTKGAEVLHYPIQLEGGARVVLTTLAPRTDAEPLDDPLAVLEELLMRSVGHVRPSPAWKLPEQEPGGYIRFRHRPYLVLLVLTELGHLAPPAEVDRNAWRIGLFTSERTIAFPCTREVIAVLDKLERMIEFRRLDPRTLADALRQPSLDQRG